MPLRRLVTLLTVGIAIRLAPTTQHRQTPRRLPTQRSTASLRELRQDHDKLREAIAQIGQRLARIEGFMGIGIPSAPDESTSTEPT